MKPFILWSLSLGVILSSWLMGCTHQQPDPDTGTLQLTFDNVVGNQDLQLATGSYTNSSGEPFGVSLLNYFVSNIRLQRSDGSTYTVPQDSSYFLVRESDPASQTITLHGVPTGAYTGVTYLVGVDSLRSTMDVSRRKGVLEPGGGHNGGMYWDWNSGYIFFKLEGSSPAVAPDPTGESRFLYHVGLFGGYDSKTINNLRTVSLPLSGGGLQLGVGQTAGVVIQADVLKVFEGSARISLAANPTVMVSTFSSTIASNYAGMFRVTHQSAQ